MIAAHSALHRHGMETCHALVPACDQCPLNAECLYLKKHPFQPKPLPVHAQNKFGS